MTDHSYPVSYDIERPREYNRWTVAFRLVLAIPHLILVGAGAHYAIPFGSAANDRAGDGLSWTMSNGLLTNLLGLLVLFAWFAIMFTGRFPAGLRDFCLLLFRWSQNVSAYVLLQANPYPPFGSGAYPLQLNVTPAAHYHRWTVFFRIFLVIPHAICLLVLEFAQAITTFIAWLAVLFTGQYPAGLFDFSVGVSRWSARVYAYVLLFVDEYPPFSMAAQPGAGAMTAQPA